MRTKEIEHYVDPVSHGPLELVAPEHQGEELIGGRLRGSAGEYEIVAGIPRFCPRENYAESFGFQWQTYSTTQLDSRALWQNESERRFFEESGWPRDLSGQRILEAGSGMGRFTEVMARAGAEVFTFDYSRAVDANRDNNRRFEAVHFSQADIFAPPFRPGSFDRVVCIGVIQHTPDPARAFQSLSRFLKPGGEIFIDSYLLSWRCLFKGKYYLRPLTRRMPSPMLHELVRMHVGWLYPLTGKLHQLIGPKASKVSWALAMADYRHRYQDEALNREHALLDTFDMLAPAHDHPASFRMVRRWFDEAGLVDVRVEPSSNGLAAVGRRPLA